MSARLARIASIVPRFTRLAPVCAFRHPSATPTGGTAYKVKVGDMILIPAKTWHLTQPDPGGLTYFLVNLMEP